MKLTDNGQGFDPAADNGGHGLASMRRRAASLGGELHVVSTACRGTTVTLKIPPVNPRLRRRRNNSVSEDGSVVSVKRSLPE
jgi:nitrate/nitrite-specific signal transduction histidine kinase